MDSYLSVPQSTHPGQVFAPGYPTVGSSAPDFNAADPYPPVPQSTYPDQVFASGYPTVGSYVPDFSAAGCAAFSHPPPTTTEMGALANLPPLDLPPQVDFANQVVNVLERQHGLTLMYHSVLLILGPCQHHVCSILASATILHIHRMRIQSLPRREFRGLPAATSWQPRLERGHSLLGGYNT